MVLHLYWSRPAQCLLVAHHGYWVTCCTRLNCAGPRTRLEPQRYSVNAPSACGYALALTNPSTCRQMLGEGNSEIKPLSQLWVKKSHCLVRTRDSERLREKTPTENHVTVVAWRALDEWNTQHHLTNQCRD